MERFAAGEIVVVSFPFTDLVSAIQKAQKLGKKVINAYFKSTSSSYLKHICDESFCLNEIIKEMEE